MPAKPRWYQFSLKTILAMFTAACVITGATIGWRSHRNYCLEQADFHRTNEKWHVIQLRRLEELTGFSMGSGKNLSLPPLPERYSRRTGSNLESYLALRKRAKEHRAGIEDERRLADYFDRAIWQPWLLWSSDAPPKFEPKRWGEP